MPKFKIIQHAADASQFLLKEDAQKRARDTFGEPVQRGVLNTARGEPCLVGLYYVIRLYHGPNFVGFYAEAFE